MKKYLLAIVSLLFFQLVYSQTAKKIGIVDDHIEPGELSGIRAMFKEFGNFNLSVIKPSDISEKNIYGFDAVWYHRTDTTGFTSEEIKLAEILKKYISQGGRLFLSMESVPLLNTAGFESKRIEMKTDSAIDEGFGRPLGFHAFKSHPLFDGLIGGGAYISKQTVDHKVRKFGFFGNSVPQEGKVIGIDWTYITFTEQNKLLLEYNVGKGMVLAAGAYFYFSPKNYNAIQLKTFTKNIFDYLTGGKSKTKPYYWNYSDTGFVHSDFSFGKLPLRQARLWQLPEPSLQVKVENPGNEFYDVVGRRVLWMGKVHDGMDEIWIHPFMACKDLMVGIQLSPGDSITWLRNCKPSVVVTPEYLVREYYIGNAVLKEMYTVSFDKPVGVAHYEWTGSQKIKLYFQMASSLRYMWPYSHKATGAIHYGYNNNINGHIISGQQGELNTVVLYSEFPLNEATGTDAAKNEVKLSSVFSLAGKAAIDITIVGSTISAAEAVALYQTNQNDLASLFKWSNNYYKKTINNHVRIETPDQDFNEGYKWALVRTDQFLQTTPGVGTALMAGFGTTARGWNGGHPISGRPGYAWYFGRDAEWSSMAIDNYGDFDMVKEQLKTLIKYQDLDGKIYHELTSSGVAHYDAADATPLFIILAAHYLKHSGDIDFIRSVWSPIEKALKFCYSTDTDGDGLIENTNVGHGWIEGGLLFGTHTEFYLAGTWAAALESMDYMSKAIGKADAKYLSQANKVKQIINNDFWNGEQEYFYNGKMQDGSFMNRFSTISAVPVLLNTVIDKEKAFKTMERITGSNYTTDWGLRIMSESDSGYNPGSYHGGMVWPLFGGWASLGAYGQGLYNAGFQYIMSNLLIYKNWAPGSIEETLNGKIFKPNGVCSHQCWSETNVIQPAIEGMLGFVPDAVNHKVSLSPSFPWEWNFCNISNLRAGTNKMNIRMQRKGNTVGYNIESLSLVELNLAPAFPLQTRIVNVKLDGKRVPYEIIQEAEGVRVKIKVPVRKGLNKLTFETQGGIGALPVVTVAEVNQPTKGLKILEQKTMNDKLTLTVEGRPGMIYTFKVYSTGSIRSAENAALIRSDNKIYTFRTKLPLTNEAYSKAYIIVTF